MRDEYIINCDNIYKLSPSLKGNCLNLNNWYK
jgi:hypothetical protein